VGSFPKEYLTIHAGFYLNGQTYVSIFQLYTEKPQIYLYVLAFILI